MSKKMKIEVVSVPDKRCECKYVKGMTWVMDGPELPGGLCIGAMSALLPWITCIKYDATMPWTKKGEIEVCCTDADYPVKFKIKIANDDDK